MNEGLCKDAFLRDSWTRRSEAMGGGVVTLATNQGLGRHGAALSAVILLQSLLPSPLPAVMAWAGHGDPTSEEQLTLELLNWIRADPLLAQKRLKLDLTAKGKFTLAPRQPLVFNAKLIEAARLHSKAMNDLRFFAHQDPQGRNPGQRVRQCGYMWRGYSENLAATVPAPLKALDNLIIDEGVGDLGHRISLLGLSDQVIGLNEVGIGIHAGTGPLKKYYTIDLATEGEFVAFIQGVVYRDTNKSGRYEVGEGIPNIKVEMSSGGASAVTSKSGGYGLPVENSGDFTLTASGAGLPTPVQKQATVKDLNVKVDFVVAK